MSHATVLHLDVSESTRNLVAATQVRVAPGSALVQISDPDAARQLLQEESEFDIALVALDLEKPGDGLGFIRWLRDEHPLGPPVYVLQSQLEPCLVVDVLNAGAEGVIPTDDPIAFTDAISDLFGLHLASAPV
ncbi:MAG: hypothetical protein ACO1SV_11980 [Fimbriimonas sp.]